jgi:hypothetical protein
MFFFERSISTEGIEDTVLSQRSFSTYNPSLLLPLSSSTYNNKLASLIKITLFNFTFIIKFNI